MEDFHTRERGQGLVEYALVLVLVAIVVIGVLSMLGPQISDVYNQVYWTLGGGGVIEGVTAVRTGNGNGNDVVVTVTVSEVTTLTIRDSQNAAPITLSCNMTCTGTLGGVGFGSGTVTVTADNGFAQANYGVKN